MRARGFGAALLIWTNLSIAGASARTFPIPPQHPVATIDVPGDWRAMSTRDGVEGSANNVPVRFAVQFILAPDLDTADRDGNDQTHPKWGGGCAGNAAGGAAPV
jgi:hypothetical protein